MAAKNQSSNWLPFDLCCILVALEMIQTLKKIIYICPNTIQLFFFFLHRFSEGLEVLFTLAVKIDQDVTKGNILMWQMALICLWCMAFCVCLTTLTINPMQVGMFICSCQVSALRGAFGAITISLLCYVADTLSRHCYIN